MTAPKVPYRLLVFRPGGRIQVLRYADSAERDRKAKALAAVDGLQVLVCAVVEMYNGGDEGAMRP